MALMDYPNRTSSNVITQKDFQELVQTTFNTVSEILEKSLGPLGSTSTILDGQSTSATKDGFGLIKKLRFTNLYKSMVFNLIKAPCIKLNNTVGDGTTTAIVLTKCLYERYQQMQSEIISKYRLPREFNNTWDEVIEEIIENITTKAIPLSNDIFSSNISVYDIARVASNGNEEISTNISNIYKEANNPMIKIANSPTNQSFVKKIDGFIFPCNLIDEAYVKNEDLSVVESNLKVLLFQYKISSDEFNNIIKPLNEVFRARSEKLLVIAPSYDELLANTILKTYVNEEYRRFNGKLNLILTQYQYTKLNPFHCEDLASLLNCQLINYDIAKSLENKILKLNEGELYDYIDADNSTYLPIDERLAIGFAPKVNLSVNHGSTFTNFVLDNNKLYQRQLELAKKALVEIQSKSDTDVRNYSINLSNIRTRISQLNMESYTYYVGANTSLECDVIYDTVDDVIKAVASASKYGIVPGCQLSIMKVCSAMILDIDNLIYKTKRENPITTDHRIKVMNVNRISILKLKLLIVQLIYDAVHDLYSKIINGPFGNGITGIHEYIKDNNYIFNGENSSDNIIKLSEQYGEVFDIEQLDFNDKIVTSVETDINVLQAASSIVKLLISGNQCLYLDPVLNSEIVDVT